MQVRREVKLRQLATFEVAGHTYAFDVAEVQEVVAVTRRTPIPCAPVYVAGLINLRGQVATALDLRRFFELPGSTPDGAMDVVCRVGDHLVSLVVDVIGDVVEVDAQAIEPVPVTVCSRVAAAMSGVFPWGGSLIHVLELEKLAVRLEAD